MSALHALLREVARRNAKASPPYLRDLFPAQRAFVLDRSRRKAALCSRRAGKTWAINAALLEKAEQKPGETVVYVGLTRATAKRLSWNELIRMNEAHSLGIKFNHSELVATLANGSRFQCVGADDVAAIERLRGGRYAAVALDEAGSFPPSILATLIDEIIDPALIDLQGTLMLGGTPRPALVGAFYEATELGVGGWSVHRWTIFDNPYIPHAREEYERVLKERAWTEQHPIVLREWLGRWVRDASALVYPYDPARNVVARLPDGAWTYVLGIDFGYSDDTACAVLGYVEGDPTVYVVESEKRAGVIPSEAAKWVQRLAARYDFARIVGDVGGLGKGYAEEMRQRYALPVRPAQKADKRGYQDLMSGELLSGRVRVLAARNVGLLDEWAMSQWLPDRSAEDPRFANHLSDAALYAWRETRAMEPEPKQAAPAHGSPEWAAEEEARMLARLERQQAEAHEADDGLDDWA